MNMFEPDYAHWYRRDGVPLHAVPAAESWLRRPTLRDARQLGLLPSVTNILGIAARPRLVSWLQEQAPLAALTPPRIKGESEDVFAKRVVTGSWTTHSGAADFGTAFPYGSLRLFCDWYQAKGLHAVWAERVLVNLTAGYAGTADLLVKHPVHGLTLLVLKTQFLMPRARPVPHRSWCCQLAAYRRALGQPVACANIILNSRVPMEPVEYHWSEKELDRGWAAFDAARTRWCIKKNFDPCAHGDASDESVFPA